MSFLRRASSVALLSCVTCVLAGCSNGDSSASPADSAVDTFDEAFAHPDTPFDGGPSPDVAPVKHCTLDNGTDPVALCTQKFVFQQWHDVAVIKSLGIAQSWDSTSFLPDKDSSGAVMHDVRDDVLFAAASARYLSSAALYGDTEIQTQVHDDFKWIVAKIETELAKPDPSNVDLYGELRDVAQELRDLSDTTNAAAIDAIADAIGAGIYDASWHELGPIVPPGGDAGDAGADAGDAGGDAIFDSTKADVPSDAPPDVPLVDGILGTRATGGGFDYVSWKAAYGAAALLDMAARHPTDAKAIGWQRAALATIDHLQRRARDATTSLLFDELVTSSDPDHDTLAGAAPNDALLTETQAGFAIALSRAQAVVDGAKSTLAPTVVAYPLAIDGAAVLEAMEGAHVWDADKGGYLQGWVPSTSSTIPFKTTRGNALMFAAIHRLNTRASAPKSAAHLKSLRTILLQRIPFNTSLLSVVPDQASWLVATSPSFDFAGLTDPRAKSLFSSANAIACEGLWEQWFGLPK